MEFQEDYEGVPHLGLWSSKGILVIWGCFWASAVIKYAQPIFWHHYRSTPML